MVDNPSNNAALNRLIHHCYADSDRQIVLEEVKNSRVLWPKLLEGFDDWHQLHRYDVHYATKEFSRKQLGCSGEVLNALGELLFTHGLEFSAVKFFVKPGVDDAIVIALPYDEYMQRRSAIAQEFGQSEDPQSVLSRLNIKQHVRDLHRLRVAANEARGDAIPYQQMIGRVLFGGRRWIKLDDGSRSKHIQYDEIGIGKAEFEAGVLNIMKDVGVTPEAVSISYPNPEEPSLANVHVTHEAYQQHLEALVKVRKGGVAR